jgi:hypothetical protein
MFREESEMDGREELNQKDGDKSLISYPQTKKTDIAEFRKERQSHKISKRLCNKNEIGIRHYA